MSYGFGFDAGLKGINAARLAMQVIGQNVANVNTPGYTRQRVLLGSSFPVPAGRGFLIGSGVEVETVQRIFDEGLDTRIRTQNGLFGQASVQYRRMTEIEGLLGEPGTTGLSGLLNDFFGAVGKLRTDAGERALRGALVQSAKGLTGGFNLLADRLARLDTDTTREVQAHLEQVNNIAARIAQFNAQIQSMESGGHMANEMRDQREVLLQGLSEIMDTQALDRGNGVVDVLAGGYLLVSGGTASRLSAVAGAEGKTEVHIASSPATIRVSGGKLAALLDAEEGILSGVRGRLDTLARTLALETNRIHSTGMAKTGPFTSLVAEHPVKDGDGDGDFADELLGYGELPFEVVNGTLYVAVTELASGNLERTALAIDPETMTLGDLSAAISNIDHLNATVDPTGRLRITAAPGHGFDFSGRLDSSPNTRGTFAGAGASLGSSRGGPYLFSTLPADFQVSVDGGPAATITLTASDFATPSAVPAAELASVLNGKFQTAGLAVTAHPVDGHLSLVAGSTGPTSSLRITDGNNAPAALLGLPAGVTATGQAQPVAVAISGSYTGGDNGAFRFVAEGDGQIGVTPGLTIGVYDRSGVKVATLDVGQGYSPGDQLEVAYGVKVSFGPGNVSGTAGQQFALDTIADADTADLLVALGLNVFFTGSTAATLGISKRIADDPDLLAAGLSLIGSKQAQGDAANLVRLEALRTLGLEALNGNTLEGFYSEMASDVGFETRKSEDILASQDTLRQFLLNQRDAISGVNIDEEMVDLVRFQQGFQASSRFISIMSEMSDVLINIGR